MARIDPAKLGQWFDAHAAQLVLYARQWRLACGPEDLVQDVFLRLMSQPAEPENVKAWLFRAVRNAAISESRTERRRAGREQRVAAERSSWFQPNPGDLIDVAAEPENVKAWLFRAVRNAAISESRTERRRAGREQRVAAERSGWFQPNPADLIDAAAAQEALGRLPETQREVVVLRIWGRMTLQEVAEMVGMPLSTVHDQYRAGLAAVRKQMESSCRTKNG